MIVVHPQEDTVEVAHISFWQKIARQRAGDIGERDRHRRKHIGTIPMITN